MNINGMQIATRYLEGGDVTDTELDQLDEMIWSSDPSWDGSRIGDGYLKRVRAAMETGTRWTRDELDKAFTAAVRNTAERHGENPDERHWKDPIETVVEPRETDVTREAIIFFTATVPTQTELWKDGKLVILLKAIGYRAGPAGDH